MFGLSLRGPVAAIALGAIAAALGPFACGGTSSETPWPVEPDDILEAPIGESAERSRPIDVDVDVDDGVLGERGSDGEPEPPRAPAAPASAQPEGSAAPAPPDKGPTPGAADPRPPAPLEPRGRP